MLEFSAIIVIVTIIGAILGGREVRREARQLAKNKNVSAPDRATGVDEYPCDLSTPDFMRAVRHFFESHQFQIKPSAPKKLSEQWWQITDADMQTCAIFVGGEWKFQDPAAPNVVSFKISMRLQLVDHPGRNVMQTGWSATEMIDSSQKERFYTQSASARTLNDVNAIVNYTIDELRLALLAVAMARNPNSQSHLLMGTLAGKLGAQKLDADYLPPNRNATDFTAPIVEKAYWPSPQDYNEAIQNPHANFDAALLRDAKPELTALGIPRAASGAFASVYKLGCNTSGRDYAVKCFLTLVHDQRERYESISNCVLNDDLEYTVDFEFIQKGILLRGKWFPILRMDWVSGLPLNSYVESHLNNREALDRLAEDFLLMTQRLRGNGIAHGDLQHGNILVTDDGIRLVDYDGMFVPGMDGWVSNELGHRNYQHPHRHPTHFAPWLDNFSAWVIYTSVKALSLDPLLWNEGTAGDESLIFGKSDFVSPDDSELLRKMSHHADATIQALADAIRQIAASPIETVPYLESSIRNGKLRL